MMSVFIQYQGRAVPQLPEPITPISAINYYLLFFFFEKLILLSVPFLRRPIFAR